jgi:hypothetical protein
MEYETAFEWKPIKRVDSSITHGKKTQATIEGITIIDEVV